MDRNPSDRNHLDPYFGQAQGPAPRKIGMRQDLPAANENVELLLLRAKEVT